MGNSDSSKIPIEPEEIYEWYSIIYPTNKRHRDELRSLLFGRGALSAAPYSIFNYLLTPFQGMSTPKCKTVIIEKRYRDRNHISAKASFYSKSFRSIPSECTRLHFFSKRLPIQSLGNLEGYQNSYLGFCVIRPFPQRCIGKTVLKRYQYNPALEFPTCHGKFFVNIGGSRLSVEGAAFMEQDTMVAACASAAIWMSTTTMAERFNLTQCSVSEITEKATEYLVKKRPMPSEGLLVEQMAHCLRSMDYDPVLLPVYGQKEAKHTAYSYVESEIPPILLCSFATGGDHTLVGVGHGYNMPVTTPQKVNIEWLGEPPISFSRSSEWVPYILVNDDQRGLYLKLNFIDGGQSLVDNIRRLYPSVDIDDLELDDWRCPVSIEMNMPSLNVHNEEIANLWGILVPLPKIVLLNAEQAEKKAARLIRVWYDMTKSTIPDDLVLRTYLIPSNEYKRRIETSEMNIFVKRLLRGKPMPKWIWITEISRLGCYNSAKQEDWLLDGVVVVDATSNEFTPDFLAFHLVNNDMGILATMKPEHYDAEQALSYVWDGPDNRYPGWIR